MHGKTRGRRLELLQSKALWKFEIVQKSPVLLDMCVCVCFQHVHWREQPHMLLWSLALEFFLLSHFCHGTKRGRLIRNIPFNRLRS